MSDKFIKVKKYYDTGLWNVKMVRNAVEKKWITDHVNEIVDVDVYNDIPIYGYNGNGIIFDFLDYETNTADH